MPGSEFITTTLDELRTRLRSKRSSDHDRHLANTSASQRTINRDGMAHLFNSEATLEQVAEAIVQYGTYVGFFRNFDRFVLRFDISIGYRVDNNGQITDCYWGEIKVSRKTGEWHVIPRVSQPSAGKDDF